MTDPALVTCTVGAWTKVATGVTQAIFHLRNLGQCDAWITEVDTTGSAPSVDPEHSSSTALPMPYETWFFKGASDVYVFCRRAAAIVRVSY